MNKKTFLVTCALLVVIAITVGVVGLVRVKMLEGELAAAKASLNETTMMVDDAAAAIAERDAMEVKLNESESYVGAIRTERDAVNAVLASIQSERDAANGTLTAVQTERDAAVAIAEAVKIERDILNTRLDAALARIAELVQEICEQQHEPTPRKRR